MVKNSISVLIFTSRKKEYLWDEVPTFGCVDDGEKGMGGVRRQLVGGIQDLLLMILKHTLNIWIFLI